MTRKASDNVKMEELVMIDAMQRLGLEDYFEEEIEFVLERLNAKLYALENIDHAANYHELALSFRLLRHQGYHISAADIFEKLKDKDGKLKEEVRKDMKSLLSIFEGCQLITLEEEKEICGEVKHIIGQLLEKSMNSIDEVQKARLIENTLRNPCHKNVARLSATPFLQDFGISLEFLHDFSNVQDPWIYEVQELARIDFDVARMNYRTQLQQISKWGEELNLEKDMNFARIEPLKWCMWSLGVFPGPNMCQHRLELAKAVSFIYIIDDIFDSHDSYHQLHQFTQAIHRWEYGDVEQLPKSMKVCFKALQDTTHAFSSKINTNFGWDPQPYLQKLWAEQLRCYLVEAKWRFTKYSPSPKEYLNNAIITSGTHVVLAHAFFLMGNGNGINNNNTLHHFMNLPSIISSTATILRLWNDTGIHTDRTRDGSDHSYIDYYMKEEKTRSSKSARHHINGIISEAWNCLNREFMSSDCVFSRDFKLACLNLARMVPIMYNNHQRCHLRSTFY